MNQTHTDIMSSIHDHANEHSDDIIAKPGAEQEALAPLLAYQSAWNLRDIEGMKTAFHFPHVRIASGNIRVIEEDTAWSTDFFDKFIAETGWHYSLWDYRHAVQSTSDKVHFAVQFTRYRIDDSVIGHYPSLWVVSLIKKRWAVQARSSFAP